MNNKLVIIISISLMFFLVSCNSDDENINIEPEIQKEIQNETSIESENQAWDKASVLSIDTRCIWCWKCAIIAPDNFSMDRSIRKAVVISQENTDSKKVSDSIKRCPTDSIHLS